MSRTIKKEKTGGKRVSSHCQNNGCCNWCKGNRTIRIQREELRVNLKSELEHQIHASDDALEAFYPEILEALYKSPFYDE